MAQIKRLHYRRIIPTGLPKCRKPFCFLLTSPIKKKNDTVTKDSLESRRIKGTAAFLFLDYVIILPHIVHIVNSVFHVFIDYVGF